MLPKILKFTDLFYNKILPKIDATPASEDDLFLLELNKIFSNYHGLSSMPNVDRSGTLKQKYNFGGNSTPVFDPHSNTSLESILIARCNELINKNKKIKFFWSGGIDSTMVLTWLMELTTVREQLEIYYTCDSVKANPMFVQEIMIRDFRIHLWSDVWVELFDVGDLVLTGMSADQLTASLDISFYEECKGWLFKPWQEYFALKGKSESFINKCHQIFSQCPVPIVTLINARWWFYFYIRYNYWVYKDWEKNLENFDTGSVTCFFNTPEFNNWSMHNINNLVGNNFNTYKQVFKDQTYKLWPNKNVADAMVKTDGNTPLMWCKKKMAVHNQGYLFMYEDSYGKPKLFKNSTYPFVNLNQLRDEIGTLNV